MWEEDNLLSVEFKGDWWQYSQGDWAMASEQLWRLSLPFPPGWYTDNKLVCRIRCRGCFGTERKMRKQTNKQTEKHQPQTKETMAIDLGYDNQNNKAIKGIPRFLSTCVLTNQRLKGPLYSWKLRYRTMCTCVSYSPATQLSLIKFDFCI